MMLEKRRLCRIPTTLLITSVWYKTMCSLLDIRAAYLIVTFNGGVQCGAVSPMVPDTSWLIVNLRGSLGL